jgi:hypothetical protein
VATEIIAKSEDLRSSIGFHFSTQCGRILVGGSRDEDLPLSGSSEPNQEISTNRRRFTDEVAIIMRLIQQNENEHPFIYEALPGIFEDFIHYILSSPRKPLNPNYFPSVYNKFQSISPFYLTPGTIRLMNALLSRGMIPSTAIESTFIQTLLEVYERRGLTTQVEELKRTLRLLHLQMRMEAEEAEREKALSEIIF